MGKGAGREEERGAERAMGLIKAASPLRAAGEVITAEAGSSTRLIHCEREGGRSRSALLRQSEWSQVDGAQRCTTSGSELRRREQSSECC